MITKEIAELLYDFVTSDSFDKFAQFLVKLKADLSQSLISLKDDDTSLNTFKRIQGQLQMIDYILVTFSKQNFDNIIEKGNKQNNIGNTM